MQKYTDCSRHNSAPGILPATNPALAKGDTLELVVRADLVAISDSAVWHDNAKSLLECADFLNAENIAHLPEGAIVINTARGDVVDDDALVAALESGRLRAAGLDVYRGEPDNIHPGYARLSNTFPLPHIGSATVET